MKLKYNAPRNPLLALSFMKKWVKGEKISNFVITRNEGSIVTYSADMHVFAGHLSENTTMSEEDKDLMDTFCIVYLRERGYEIPLIPNKEAPITN